MRFKPEQFTGNPGEQARKAELATRIYKLHSLGYSWDQAQRLAKVVWR